MAEEQYKDYLAARVLTEHKPVTYRLLSRALKTNVNTAKRMLFEFHKKQNARKPGSVHATYLITGTPRRAERSNGVNNRSIKDIDMKSDESDDSDFASDSDDEDTPAPRGVRETHVVLVQEEDLDDTRAEFEEGACVHVYSVEPGPIEILGVLSMCNHEAGKEYANEDPLERWSMYGSIRNQYIKRRTAKYARPNAATTSKPTAKPVPKPATKATATIRTKEKEAPAPAPARRGSASEENASGRSTPQPSTGSAALKKQDPKSGAKKDKATSDIFKSFAKAKSKPKEAEKSKESTPAPVEDEPMQGMSEDEGDPDDEPEIKIDEEKNEAARKAREERAERLRKMMDDDDEEMPDAPAATDAPAEATAPATVDEPQADEGEDTVTVSNGRRRGRRRVMKKKKVKDEDGYLVTKEEFVWESFSEDEPVPKKAKPAPKPANTAKGKNAGKKGQGSIANFFKKA
ncbi:CDC27 domain containing protein [Pyrenophora teres f. teres]|uniref:DNA polymerase delta subunit 3 n=1 Tax=Pyrenophora teres f. teres TaxID=97479 RepID=A0A6S6WAC0_9PLEO|nr:CDC27 domain containing protein [Pyrenophora teres f. teres]